MTTAAVEPKPISRREFLYYVWGASGALAMTGACGLSVWYLLPDRQITPANGYFRIPNASLPTDLRKPVLVRDGYISGYGFWLASQSTGLIAFKPTCPLRGCRYRWVESDYYNSFVCPCCATRFKLDGTAYYGPASRALDRYPVYVTTTTERRETPSDGSPVNIDGATDVVVYIRRVIEGAPRNWAEG